MSGYLGTKAVLLSTTTATVGGDSTVGGDLTVDTNTLYVDSTNNRVGVGTASPSNPFQVGTSDLIVDSSGNLLVGKTAIDSGVAGFEVDSDGKIAATRDGSQVAIFNRLTSDGDIVTFRKDGTTLGSIGVHSNAVTGINLRVTTNKSGLRGAASSIIPWYENSDRDNELDLGTSGVRWDDVYATNGTIQTSDENEKQQIAALTDAEITAAKAISKLFKTFKWNDSVTEKGDAARTHTGVIAQEVEQAMTDAGLNAGDYAFFISTTWWEADGETYENAEDAPEGATERNRKGIRYPQLLSFIGAATEQRLTSIETRLDALEA